MGSLLNGPTGSGSVWMLLVTMALIGILHTMVPDHWVPITLVARQYRWSKQETGRFAALAGMGHVLTTLFLGLLVWVAGKAAALRFGHALDTYASLGLVVFGGWFAVRALKEVRHSGKGSHSHTHGRGPLHPHDHDHDHPDSHESFDGGGYRPDPAVWAMRDKLYYPEKQGCTLTHLHSHRHEPEGMPHSHFHDHGKESAHPLRVEDGIRPPVHDHRHKMASRTYLLLLLGSSPMVEGIPLFFAAGKLGGGTITLMSAVFAASTILTYIVLCTYSAATMQNFSFGPLERYGEVLSGLFIVMAGTVFWFFPVF